MRIALPLLAAGSLLLGMAGLWSATSEEVPARLAPAVTPSLTLQDLRPGDVILSKGQTGASHAVMAISGNLDAWTHAGIISTTVGTTAFFLHATPDFLMGQGSGIERVPIRSFLAQDKVVRVGVFRTENPRAGEQAGAWADRLLGRGIAFDQQFDLDTTADLYCTELVYKAYREGAHWDIVPAGPQSLWWSFQQVQAVLPDNLAASPRLKYLGDLK